MRLKVLHQQHQHPLHGLTRRPTGVGRQDGVGHAHPTRSFGRLLGEDVQRGAAKLWHTTREWVAGGRWQNPAA